MQKLERCCDLRGNSEQCDSVDRHCFRDQRPLEGVFRGLLHDYCDPRVHHDPHQTGEAGVVPLLQDSHLGPNLAQGLLAPIWVHYGNKAASVHSLADPLVVGGSREDRFLALDLGLAEEELGVDVLQEHVRDDLTDDHGVVLGQIPPVVLALDRGLLVLHGSPALLRGELVRILPVHPHTLVAGNPLFDLGQTRVQVPQQRHGHVDQLTDDPDPFILGILWAVGGGDHQYPMFLGDILHPGLRERLDPERKFAVIKEEPRLPVRHLCGDSRVLEFICVVQPETDGFDASTRQGVQLQGIRGVGDGVHDAGEVAAPEPWRGRRRAECDVACVEGRVVGGLNVDVSRTLWVQH